jgi:preprotein translocase subunit SecA
MTPPITDEAMESKMVALALQQAQKQLENGTASSQIVTHFLRLGSTRAQIELEELQLKNRLLEEKIASEQSGQRLSEMFQEVLAALKSYSYTPPGDYHDLDIF